MDFLSMLAALANQQQVSGRQLQPTGQVMNIADEGGAWSPQVQHRSATNPIQGGSPNHQGLANSIQGGPQMRRGMPQKAMPYMQAQPRRAPAAFQGQYMNPAHQAYEEAFARGDYNSPAIMGVDPAQFGYAEDGGQYGGNPFAQPDARSVQDMQRLQSRTAGGSARPQSIQQSDARTSRQIERRGNRAGSELTRLLGFDS